MASLHRIGVLVRMPVVNGDVRLGVAVDALFDVRLSRLVGFDVRCRDGANRFLPFPACEVREDRLAVESALVLLHRELEFYRAGGRAFSELVGEEVTLAGGRIGPLEDLLVDREGSLASVAVSASSGPVQLEPGPVLAVGNHVLRPAV